MFPTEHLPDGRVLVPRGTDLDDVAAACELYLGVRVERLEETDGGDEARAAYLVKVCATCAGEGSNCRECRYRYLEKFV